MSQSFCWAAVVVVLRACGSEGGVGPVGWKWGPLGSPNWDTSPSGSLQQGEPVEGSMVGWAGWTGPHTLQ